VPLPVRGGDGLEEFRILFVDDETEFLQTLLKRMKKRVHAAFGAENGDEALSFLAHNPVDVVVLDVRMPGMDGIEVLREIKKRYPLIEVIMLTGHASMEAAIQGMDLGAFDYLMKPMDIDELLYKVQDACQNKALQEKKIEKIKSVIR
jgi:DNA-binding NtrC family response regulator